MNEQKTENNTNDSFLLAYETFKSGDIENAIELINTNDFSKSQANDSEVINQFIKDLIRSNIDINTIKNAHFIEYLVGKFNSEELDLLINKINDSMWLSLKKEHSFRTIEKLYKHSRKNDKEKSTQKKLEAIFQVRKKEQEHQDDIKATLVQIEEGLKKIETVYSLENHSRVIFQKNKLNLVKEELIALNTHQFNDSLKKQFEQLDNQLNQMENNIKENKAQIDKLNTEKNETIKENIDTLNARMIGNKIESKESLKKLIDVFKDQKNSLIKQINKEKNISFENYQEENYNQFLEFLETLNTDYTKIESFIQEMDQIRSVHYFLTHPNLLRHMEKAQEILNGYKIKFFENVINQNVFSIIVQFEEQYKSKKDLKQEFSQLKDQIITDPKTLLENYKIAIDKGEVDNITLLKLKLKYYFDIQADVSSDFVEQYKELTQLSKEVFKWQDVTLKKNINAILEQMQVIDYENVTANNLKNQISVFIQKWKELSQRKYSQEFKQEYDTFRRLLNELNVLCRTKYKEYRQLHKENNAKRLEISNQIEVFLEKVAWNKIVWKDIQKIYVVAWNDWNAVYPVDKEKIKPVKEKFKANMSLIKTKLHEQVKVILEKKNLLIQSIGDEILEKDEAFIQNFREKWFTIENLGDKKEIKVNMMFKKLMDQWYENRRAQKSEQKEVFKAINQQAFKIIDDISNLLNNDQISAEEKISLVKKFTQEFNEIENVSRKLIKQFDEIVEKFGKLQKKEHYEKWLIKYKSLINIVEQLIESEFKITENQEVDTAVIADLKTQGEKLIINTKLYNMIINRFENLAQKKVTENINQSKVDDLKQIALVISNLADPKGTINNCVSSIDKIKLMNNTKKEINQFEQHSKEENIQNLLVNYIKIGPFNPQNRNIAHSILDLFKLYIK